LLFFSHEVFLEAWTSRLLVGKNLNILLFFYTQFLLKPGIVNYWSGKTRIFVTLFHSKFLLKPGKVDYWSGKIRIFAGALGYWAGGWIHMANINKNTRKEENICNC
jgi:hypothetical protein